MNITFVLPRGMTVGGTTIWSLMMSRKLAECEQGVTLLEHVREDLTCKANLHPHVRHAQHYGTYPPWASAQHINEYLPLYQSTLPATIIPNYVETIYAICAMMSQQQAEMFRLIGVAHADERYYYELLRYYEPIIHVFLAVSDEIAANLRRRLPHRAADIVARPCAVEIPQGVQRSYSAPQTPIRLVYAGRLQNKQKRINDLLRLAERLQEYRVNFELQIVGAGQKSLFNRFGDEEQFRRDIRNLATAIRRRIHLKGRVPHHRMTDVWDACDICVLVSEYEGTSLTMLEAMAHGCVPVVTRVSGTQAIIEPGHNGYLVNVGDIEEMARIIQHLETERTLLHTLGYSAHHTIAQRFSYQQYLPWFLNLNQHIWAQPPRRWPSERSVLKKTPKQFLKHAIMNRVTQRFIHWHYKRCP